MTGVDWGVCKSTEEERISIGVRLYDASINDFEAHWWEFSMTWPEPCGAAEKMRAVEAEMVQLSKNTEPLPPSRKEHVMCTNPSQMSTPPRGNQPNDLVRMQNPLRISNALLPHPIRWIKR